MIDFRLSTGYFEHPKIIKLKRRCGDTGVLSHIRLIRFCASNPTRWDGNLFGMSDEDIAIAAGWEGDEKVFVQALIECGLVDELAGGRALHDWADHNPYITEGIERSEKAKKAASSRWAKHKQAASNANASLVEGTQDANALPAGLPDDTKARLSNAPTYPTNHVPTNNPPSIPPSGGGGSDDASPSEESTENAKGYSAEFEQAWQAFPQRAGGNSKKAAFKAWVARLREGVTPRTLIDGVTRYRAFCEATGKIGTETVKMAASFFGPNEHYLESWEPPAGASRPGASADPPIAPGRAGITTNGGKSVFELLGVNQPPPDPDPRRIKEAAG